MNKSLMKTALASFMLCAVDLYAVNVSNGAIRLGEWNSNFLAAKSLAESSNIPMLIYWGSTSCPKCSKLKSAIEQSDFLAWQAQRKLVMVLCQNTDNEDSKACKNFAKNGSLEWPYMMVYWPKADGSAVSAKFTGRSTSIPASGSSLQAKLMNYVDQNIAGWNGQASGGEVTPTPQPAPSVPMPGPEWDKARTLFGALYSADGVLSGRIQVKAGKKSRGSAKIKATVTDIYGKSKSTAQKSFTLDATTKGTLTGQFCSYDFSITQNQLSGIVTIAGDEYEVRSAVASGVLPDGALFFSLINYPTSCQGNEVIEGAKYLPIDQKFTTKSSRWIFDRKGTLKYDRNANTFVMSTTANPSALKLSYKSKTGFFKGTFTIYTKKSRNSIKRYTANVTGFMNGDEGAGLATVKNVGVFNCIITDTDSVTSSLSKENAVR